ncbi:MAG: ABC transporter ATP-binding protein [Geminicoccaceae bacterium]
MAQIRLTNLHKSFGDFVAVRDSSLTIEDGSFFVLLGPSGCGKTTTLRMIAGLELPTSGEIRLDGEDVTFRRARERDIAFVFQLFALYPHMNVRKNIGFPLSAQGVPRAEIRRRVEETAKLLRIDHLLNRAVGGLAGGDRQRVALGRAIVRRPKAFLMDEPLGTLDAAFRELMCEELRGLHDRIGATTVYVTHDQIEAMAMADVIAVMNMGLVLQSGTPFEIYHRPRSMFVAQFIGSPSMNFLPCASGDRHAVSLAGRTLPVPELREAAPGRLVLGVRPEHVRLADDGVVRGEVFGVEYMGARQVVTVDTEAGRLRVRTSNTQRASIGEQVGLAFDPGQIILFDPSSERALPSALFEREIAFG